jgi:hypothetical protein
VPDADITAVTPFSDIAGTAGPILHDGVGPFPASPSTPRTSCDQYTHMRAFDSVILRASMF